jgi:hypothetical protein
MWLTPELARLTSPEEQELIEDLGSAVGAATHSSQAAYRLNLPHHNYSHIYGDVLPEGLRLLELDTKNNTPGNRFVMIGGLTTHDMWTYLPLDRAEGFKTKEERTATLAEPILRRFFSKAYTEAMQGVTIATSAGVTCETPIQRIARRADINNIGSKNNTPFLATTVRIFHEEVILCHEAREETPQWTPFIDRQHGVLSKLLEQDLSVGTELVNGNGMGPFNREAGRNVAFLGSKLSVRNPHLFVSRYGRYIEQLVPTFQDIAPYIKAEAAA